MNRILDDYLRKLSTRLDHLPLGERDAVLREIRDHLETAAAALQKEEGLSRDEAALKATTSFGAPDEIGVAYGPQGGVIRRKSTGEVVLRVAALTGRAAGRGIKGVLKWTAISALILVGLATVVLVAGLFLVGDLAETFENDIRESVPRPLYSYSATWGATDPQTNTLADSFQVGSRVKEFRIHFDTSPSTGCLSIQLVSPGGAVTDINGNGCEGISKMLTFTEQGTWQVRYTFVAFTGTVDVEAYAFENAHGSGSDPAR